MFLCQFVLLKEKHSLKKRKRAHCGIILFYRLSMCHLQLISEIALFYQMINYALTKKR